MLLLFVCVCVVSSMEVVADIFPLILVGNQHERSKVHILHLLAVYMSAFIILENVFVSRFSGKCTNCVLTACS